MTPAERQGISWAKEAVQSTQEFQVGHPLPDQSSQSDSGELPTPQYVPLLLQDFSTPANPKKKTMTDAERKSASRAQENEEQTQRRFKDQKEDLLPVEKLKMKNKLKEDLTLREADLLPIEKLQMKTKLKEELKTCKEDQLSVEELKMKTKLKKTWRESKKNSCQ